MNNITIPSNLFTTFNDITFYDVPHKYFLNKKEFISVTTLIHKYQEEFDENYWSEYKSIEHNVPKDKVIRAWNFINKKGTMKGSAIHDYAENLFQNKEFDYPKQKILDEFGFDPIINEYIKTKKFVDKFYNDVHDKLIPIKTEYVLYDVESMIAGMLDIIFYNVKTNELQIWDWKTNKKFSKECKERRLLNELYLLEDTDFNIYSLQLSLYKYIIEKNTGIKLGKCYIVWFSHNNDTYEIMETKDMSYYINKIVEKRISELKA